MKLRWSETADADRWDLFSFVYADSEHAAQALDDRLVDCTTRLIRFPRSGRTGRVAGTFELVVPNTPYLAVYIIDLDEVVLLRILHQAQQWPG